jgi:arabinofuranan 3-O-arabinosyltransferase
VADLYDAEPRLDLTWQTPRVVTSVRLLVDTEGQDFSDPLAVTITVGGRSIDAFAGPGALVPLPPTTATRVSIIVRRTTPMVSVDGVTGLVTPVPVAISEVELGGVSDLVYRPDLTTRSGAVCGLGPGLLVDGEQTQTQVDTTLGAILRGGEVRIEPCGTNPEVTLSAGTHRITLTGTGLVDPVRLAVTGPSSPAATRTSVIGTWDASSRSVQVGAGGPALLRVAESANAGWVATLDGQTLDPVRVDGWQQGWMLPAGAGGTVTLVYAPSRTQQAGLAAGAVLAVLALLLGLLAPGRGSRWTASTRRWPRPVLVVAAAVVTAGLLLGTVGLLAAVPAVVASGRRWSPAASAGAVAVAAIGAGLGWAAMTVSAATLTGFLLAWASALRRRVG